MPITRYFLFTGGLLLTLPFAADHYLPAPVDRISRAGIDKSIIRIRSARVVPDKLELDISRPIAVPPSATFTDERSEDRPREAYGMMTEPSVATELAGRSGGSFGGTWHVCFE